MGDLIFIGHAGVAFAGRKGLVLLVLDAAASLLWAAAQDEDLLENNRDRKQGGGQVYVEQGKGGLNLGRRFCVIWHTTPTGYTRAGFCHLKFIEGGYGRVSLGFPNLCISGENWINE